MALSRRGFGFGLFAASATATGSYLVARNIPQVAAYLDNETELLGFVGGEKMGFVENQRVKNALLHQFELTLDARRAGSVEMAREPDLLSQHPDFLWPSSSVIPDIARLSGVHALSEHVILNSPIVLYSWDRIAEQLVKSSYAQSQGGPRYTVDLVRMLKAVINGQDWSALGVSELYGHARILSTDPNRSNSGFMFAGLSASLLAGDVVTTTMVDRIAQDVVTIFQRMGFKPSSSGKMFDDYIAGGPAAQPLIVGYENQLVEWVVADPERWKQLSADAPSKPVVLYPQPTVFSAHPLLALTPPAERLITALNSTELLEMAWQDHGFRGPLGTIGQSRNPLLQTYLIDEIPATVPMPEAAAMLALLDRLAH